MSKNNKENTDNETKTHVRAVRLNKMGDASRFLQRVINELYRKEIEGNRASKLGYLINILLSAQEKTQLADEIEVLKKRIDQIERQGQ